MHVPAVALCRLTADPLRTNPFRRETRRCTMRFPMTTPELCELAGLTRPELQRWIDAGLLQAESRRSLPGIRRRRARTCTPDQRLACQRPAIEPLGAREPHVRRPVCHLRWPEFVYLPG